jgi:hypothetical protein
MATFRTSRFIDFDAGLVRVPPMVLQKSLPPRDQQSIDQMLLLFECRVDVWKFGPAVEMLKAMDLAEDQGSVWSHSAYALLDVTCSYFEMVGKVLNPDSRISGTAGLDFNHGFCDIYPEFGTAGPDRTDTALPVVKAFRDRLRNGMYHLGYTKTELMIHNQPLDYPKDFMVVSQAGCDFYLVNPHQMTRTIVAHFEGFMSRLRTFSGEFEPMRNKFREFFVDYHVAALPKGLGAAGNPIHHGERATTV